MSITQQDEDDYQAYLDSYAADGRPVGGQKQQAARRPTPVFFGFGPIAMLLSVLWRFQRVIWITIGTLLGLVVASFVVPMLLGFVFGTGICWPVLTFALLAVAARFTGDRPRPREFLNRLVAVARINRDTLTRGAIAAVAIGASMGVVSVVSGEQGPFGALDLAAGSTLTLMVATVGLLELVNRHSGTHSEPFEPNRAPARSRAAVVEQAPPAPRQIDAPGPRSAANRKATS